MGRGRQAVLRFRRQAVGGDDVEPRSRQQRDAGGPRLGVARGERLQHGELAGDVQVVGAGAQASVDERRGGAREWARAVEHHGDPRERRGHRRGIVDGEHARGPSELGGERVHGVACRPPRIAGTPRAAARRAINVPVYPFAP